MSSISRKRYGGSLICLVCNRSLIVMTGMQINFPLDLDW